MFAVGALFAAGHRPADLVPNPGILYVPGLVIHPYAGDLLPILAPRAAADQPALIDVEVDGPLAVVVLCISAVGAVLGELSLHPLVGEGQLHGLLFG